MYVILDFTPYEKNVLLITLHSNIYLTPKTLVSCLGKLFTVILSERLSKYSDDFFVMHDNQCGFRQGYCTVDYLFTLYSFFELLKRKKKKMYCAFIEFEKASFFSFFFKFQISLLKNSAI